MAALDLVVRNARVITAADEMLCDIGIRGGQIVQMGSGLPAGLKEIDAQGCAVTPGGGCPLPSGRNYQWPCAHGR